MRARRFIAQLKWSISLAIVAAAVITVGLVTRGAAQETTTQASMRGIFTALTAAYNYSLDPDVFADPNNRQAIVGVLEALAANADALDTHGGALDPSFEYLQRSLARDGHEALQRFKNGNYIGSRFSLNKITENCVTCHTKLPANKTFDLGGEFLEAAQVEELPPFSRVELEVATRQFGAALDTYEEIILDPDVTPADLALNNVFENYLKISIGAMADTQRPAATLQEFASRPGVPASLKKEATRWVEALNALDLSEPAGKELATARALIEDAVQNTDPPSDRSYLVEFITSIALLHRYLATGPTDDLQISEAYYLLGLAESYVARSYWISETAFLLEKSIRQAPQSETARQALALLEQYTETSYRITPARSVPPELQTNLDELRALTQQ